MTQPRRIQRILVANRGEISIRVSAQPPNSACAPSRCIRRKTASRCTVSRRTRAYLVGEGQNADAGLSRHRRHRCASPRRRDVDAVHPGYGFLSENPDFARGRASRPALIWVGPPPEVMATLGNKVAARNAAVAGRGAGDAGHGAAAARLGAVRKLAAEVGYPLMLKASWGGGGRGMRVIDRAPNCSTSCWHRAPRSADRVRQRRGVSRKAGAARAPRRGADPGRHARQRGASVRARLHRAAAQPESGRARARALPRRGAARGTVRLRRSRIGARSATRTPARSNS